MNDLENIKDDIPKDILEIINYISEKEIDYSKDVYENIKKETIEKFGNKGLEVFEELHSEFESDNLEECPDCNSSEEEIFSEEEDSKTLPDFILESIASDLIDENSKNPTKLIVCSDILKSVEKIYPEFLQVISEDEIRQICQWTIIKLSNEQWLQSKIFDLTYIPSDIRERSKLDE